MKVLPFSVKSYLCAVRSATDDAAAEFLAGSPETYSPSAQERKRIVNGKTVAAVLRQARVFEIPLSAFCAVEESVRRQLGRDLLDPPRPLGTFRNKMWRRIQKAARTAEEIERLPFESVFLAPSEMFLIEGSRSPWWEGEDERPGSSSQFVHGFHLTAAGLVTQFIWMPHGEEGEEPAVAFDGPRDIHDIEVIKRPGQPWRPNSHFPSAPWVLKSIVDYINAHRTFVMESSLSYRMNYTDLRKKVSSIKPIPPPFYRVELRNQLLRSLARRVVRGFSVTLNHRFDVRGHERIKVRRGHLPISDRLRAVLEKRKYTVFTNSVPDEVWRQLGERGIPRKRSDEWLAVKKAWVDPYIKGPEDAPYVPSLRVIPENTGR